MSNGTAQADGQPCGCCTGPTQQTPEAIANRPALSSIAYRAGRYSTFNASMLAALSDPAFPALAPLRTRDTTDFSIALIDAWAVALDILTFYQERFANEAYLRTAVDQRSVFELAELVGYVPSPGVAASAVLAFTLSSATGSPDNVLIPAGSRVQSVPGPGQTAQIFETSADLTAVIGWNALPAQTTIPWQLAGSDTSTWMTGTANSINVGDALLFVQADDGQPSATGPADFHYVTAVTPDPVSGNTQIWWDGPLSGLSGTADPAGDMGPGDVALYIFRKKAALYGVQAPNPQLLSGDFINQVPGYPREPGGHVAPRWHYFYTGGSYQINLDTSYPGLAPPADGSPRWLVLTSPSDTAFFQIAAVAETSPDRYTLTVKTTQLTINAKAGQSVPSQGSGSFDVDGSLSAFVTDTPDVTAYVQSAQLTPASLPYTSWSQDPPYTRQPGMLAPVVRLVGTGHRRPADRARPAGRRVRQVPADPGFGRHLHAGQPGRRLRRRGRAGVRDQLLPARHRPGDREPAVDGDDPERRSRDAERPGG